MTMAAACYPDAQAKVQAQLDRVVGRDRGKIRALVTIWPECR